MGSKLSIQVNNSSDVKISSENPPKLFNFLCVDLLLILLDQFETTPTIYPNKCMLMCILYQILVPCKYDKQTLNSFPIKDENIILKLFNYIKKNYEMKYCQYNVEIIKKHNGPDLYYCWQEDIIDFGENVKCYKVKSDIDKFYFDYIADINRNIKTKIYTDKEMRLYKNVNCYHTDNAYLHIFKLRDDRCLMIINIEDIELPPNLLNSDFIYEMMERVKKTTNLTVIDLIIPKLEYRFRRNFPYVYFSNAFRHLENKIETFPKLNDDNDVNPNDNYIIYNKPFVYILFDPDLSISFMGRFPRDDI